MNRVYRKWFSPALGREMELLVFGQSGMPAIVFPPGGGMFFDWENQGMVEMKRSKLENGQLRIVCVDSGDGESWYKPDGGGREKIVRHMQFERYVMDEVLPMVRDKTRPMQVVTSGVGLGGYHALNLMLKHPDVFTGGLSMGGRFALEECLGGYLDEDCYYNLPLRYMPNLEDPWYLERLRRNTFVLATGEQAEHREENERMAEILRAKQIPVRMDAWGDGNGKDWTLWKKMLTAYT